MMPNVITDIGVSPDMSSEDDSNAGPAPINSRACDICMVHRWNTGFSNFLRGGLAQDYGERRRSLLV
jgi:hypothetical protein